MICNRTDAYLFSTFHNLTFRVADLYVSQLSRGCTLFLTRYGGARKNKSTRFRGPHLCLAAVGPAFAGPDLYLQSRAFAGRHTMIKSGFPASPETNQKKPPEIDSPSLSRQPAGPGSLRTGESLFSRRRRGLRRRRC